MAERRGEFRENNPDIAARRDEHRERRQEYRENNPEEAAARREERRQRFEDGEGPRGPGGPGGPGPRGPRPDGRPGPEVAMKAGLKSRRLFAIIKKEGRIIAPFFYFLIRDQLLSEDWQ